MIKNTYLFYLFLLLSFVYSQHVPSDAELWKASIDYGSGIPSELSSDEISGVLLTSPEAVAVFEFQYRTTSETFYPFPTVGATKINDNFRAIANTQSDLFTGGLANIEYHSSALNWVSGGNLSPKVLVTNSETNNFYTSLGAIVTEVNVLNDPIPSDIDVLVLDYSSYNVWSDSEQNQLYDITAEFISRTATPSNPKGIIIGGNPSYYKWTHYGSCSAFPGNLALQQYGITFICDYWGVRDNFISPSTFTYLQENIYYTLQYLADIDGRAYTNEDISTLMDVNIFPKMLTPIYNGCSCGIGDDALAPVSYIYDIIKPLLTDILSDAGCNNMVMPMDIDYEKYCAELIIVDSYLFNTPSDISPAITSDIFPGMSSDISESDTISSKTVNISTNFCLKQSVGLWALPGVEFTVTIPDEYINELQVYVGIWNGDVRKFSAWERIPAPITSSYDIDATTITIANSFGGPIYINIPCDYFEDNESFMEFDVTFTNVVPMLYYKKGETTESDWTNQLSNNPAPWGEIEADYTIFTIPRSDIEVETFETISSVADNWSIIVSEYADFRDQIPDLFKERGIVDIHVAFGYMFASYPMNGPLNEANSLLHDPNSWGWLHEMGHRFERGNSYGPEAGAMWNMFEGNVEVFTNVFSCIGIQAMNGDNSRCIDNFGADATIGYEGSWDSLGFFERLDFYIMLRDGFTWEAFTNTLTRGRTYRFPNDNNERRTRLWLLFSERVKRNVKSLFDMYNIDVYELGLYNQIIFSDYAINFIKMDTTPVDYADGSSINTNIIGDISCGLSGPSHLPSTSYSCLFTNGGRIESSLVSSTNNEVSLSFWININNYPSNSISIIETSNFKVLLQSSGSLELFYESILIIPSSTIPLSEWIHILITSDNNESIIYINGIMDTSIIPIEQLSGVNTMIILNNDGLFDGSLSEVALFDYVLLSDRAIAHYTPSPYQYKPWISPRYLPDPIDGCNIIPQQITACQTPDGLFDTIPSHCEQCLAYYCNDDPEPIGIDCSEVCPSGTIIDAFSGACFDCHSTCSECSLPNNSNACIECDLNGSTPYIEESSCVSECSIGYILVDGPPGPLSICSKCHSTCNTCEGTESNECLTCNNSLVFNDGECLDECPSNKVLHIDQCIDECPIGMFADLSNICQDCHDTCQTCSIESIHCDSCDENGQTPYFTLDSNTCSASCNSGYYHSSGSFNCEICSEECLTCQDSSDYCTSCDQNGNTPYFFIDTCINECPPYTLQDNNLFICEGCDINGEFPYELDGDCVSECNNGQVIHLYECIDECPSQFYNNNNFCESCNSNCVTCIDSPIICTSCGDPTPLLDNNTCVNTCPNGKYPNMDICNDCHSSCDTCNGGSINNCLTCDENSELFIYHDNSCIDECPQNTYLALSNTCEVCDLSCNSCFGSNPSDCLSCSGNLYLENGFCVSDCSTGFYKNISTNTCNICDSNCLTCESSPTFCTSCNPNGNTPIYNIDDNICEEECNGVLHEDECLSSCPNGYFANNEDICIECNSNCETCSNNEDHCLTCDASSITPYFNDITSTCISDCRSIDKVGFEFECISICPDGTFDDEVSLECQVCNNNCLRCKSENECIQCNPLVINRILYNGECISSCPSGTFEQGGSCFNCHSSCETCTSDNMNSCLSCFNGFHLENGQCIEDESCNPLDYDWSIELESIDIESLDISLPMELFEQDILCMSGTSNNNCIPYGSLLNGLYTIEFYVSSTIECSHECNNDSNFIIQQRYISNIDVSQEIYRVISLINDINSVYNDFVNEVNLIFISSGILDSLYTNAKSQFQSDIENNIESICSSMITNLNDNLLATSTLVLDPLGIQSSNMCDISSSLSFITTPRCICDSSVDEMLNPCQNIRELDFTDAICHPNHCINNEFSEFYITLHLDNNFNLFSDELLMQAIEILNTWIGSLELSQFREVRVFRVDNGSVILFIDVSDSNGITDIDTLVLLYNALLNGDINMESSILLVEISFPLSESSSLDTSYPQTYSYSSYFPSTFSTPSLTFSLPSTNSNSNTNSNNPSFTFSDETFSSSSNSGKLHYSFTVLLFFIFCHLL